MILSDKHVFFPTGYECVAICLIRESSSFHHLRGLLGNLINNDVCTQNTDILLRIKV